jgi:hypothetical protein
LDYNKEEAIKLLSEKFGWRPYQEKHYESVWTRFYQGYYLIEKFGFDKRRPHFSALINSSQLSRDNALNQMEIQSYNQELFKKDYDFTLKKFGLSDVEFREILQQPPKSHIDFPNLHNLYLKSSKFQDTFVKIAKKT